MIRSYFSYQHCHLDSLSPIAPNFGFIDSSTEKGGGRFFKLFKQADLLKLKDKISLGIIPNSDKEWWMRDVKEDITEGEKCRPKGCRAIVGPVSKWGRQALLRSNLPTGQSPHT